MKNSTALLKSSYNRTLIVGGGRLAKHLSHYFKISNISFVNWTRDDKRSLNDALAKVDRVCLCLPDSALNEFYKKHPQLSEVLTVHFSAVTDVPNVFWAHPLMTFGPDLYERDVYPAIPFVLAAGGVTLPELFPELSNRAHYIPTEKRALYHALCVLSGNFTTILWQTAFRRFESDLNLDSSALIPYLEQVMTNLISRPADALTGPLVRGDTKTMVQHLDSLRNSPEQHLYYAFLNFVLADRKSRGEVIDDRLRI